MIRAVLFDLDDTLLDINLTYFVARYGKGLSDVLSRIARVPSIFLYPKILRAYMAVDNQNRLDTMTNEELLNTRIFESTGVPIDDPVIADAISTFEHEIVPSYRDTIVAAHPRPGMRAAVTRVHELGLICALASNPLFSMEVDRTRMTWANVNECDFAAISHISNSRRTKPSADYYLDFLGGLGLKPEECLMVGNDARRDFPWPRIGLRTLYVGHARPARAFWRGRPERLAGDLKTIIDFANEQDVDQMRSMC